MVRDASKRGEGHGMGWVYLMFLPKMPYGRKVHWFQKAPWNPHWTGDLMLRGLNMVREHGCSSS